MQEIDKIMKMMCEEVGVNFEEMNFKKPGWYLEHSWTEKQENKFKRKLLTYLLDNKEARDGFMETPTDSKLLLDLAINSFVMTYGWKVKE